MSKGDLLFQYSVNRVLKQIAGHSESCPYKMETEEALSRSLEVSRTTVRKIFEYLMTKGIIRMKQRKRWVQRKPASRDFLSIDISYQSKSEDFEAFFLSKLSNRELSAGQNFSELELAKASGCNTATVNKVLLKISHSGLILKQPRKRWQVLKMDIKMVEELCEAREMLEVRAVQAMIQLPESHHLWNDLRDLKIQHEELLKKSKNLQKDFIELDKVFHKTLLEATDNRFIEKSFFLISFLIHHNLHFDQRSKDIIKYTIPIHLDIINAILSKNLTASIEKLQYHIGNAKELMLESCSE